MSSQLLIRVLHIDIDSLIVYHDHQNRELCLEKPKCTSKLETFRHEFALFWIFLLPFILGCTVFPSKTYFFSNQFFSSLPFPSTSSNLGWKKLRWCQLIILGCWVCCIWSPMLVVPSLLYFNFVIKFGKLLLVILGNISSFSIIRLQS